MKYLTEVERTKACPNTVNSLYSGHCWDLKLVSSVARVRNSGSLFQSNVCNLFLPRIYLLSVLSGCPLLRGVRKAGVDCSDFFLSWLHGFGKYKSEFRQNASEIIP